MTSYVEFLKEQIKKADKVLSTTAKIMLKYPDDWGLQLNYDSVKQHRDELAAQLEIALKANE
jgi:hypothetical protein